MKATQDNLEFVSKLSDIDIYGINNQLYINSSIDVGTSATASVHFTIHPIVREWGVKCIDISFSLVRVAIEWEVDAYDISSNDMDILTTAGGVASGEYPNKKITGVVNVNTDGGGGWRIIDNLEFQPDGCLCIKSIELDFSAKTLTIS